MLYFVKRTKRSGYLGCTKASTGDKRRIQWLKDGGYKIVSKDAYLQARVAMVGF